MARSKTTLPLPEEAIDFKSAVDFVLALFIKIRALAEEAIDFKSAVEYLLASITNPPPEAAIDFRSAVDFNIFLPYFYHRQPVGTDSRAMFS